MELMLSGWIGWEMNSKQAGYAEHTAQEEAYLGTVSGLYPYPRHWAIFKRFQIFSNINYRTNYRAYRCTNQSADWI